MSRDAGYVDDNADNRELLTRYLERSGHQVLTASSGMEALARLADRPVDVVLLDLIMPGMDGNQVLKRLKENAQLRSIPVIVISGRQEKQGGHATIETDAQLSASSIRGEQIRAVVLLASDQLLGQLSDDRL